MNAREGEQIRQQPWHLSTNSTMRSHHVSSPQTLHLLFCGVVTLSETRWLGKLGSCIFPMEIICNLLQGLQHDIIIYVKHFENSKVL